MTRRATHRRQGSGRNVVIVSTTTIESRRRALWVAASGSFGAGLTYLLGFLL